MQSTLSNLSLEEFITYFLRFVSALQPPNMQLSQMQLEVLKATLLLPEKFQHRLFTFSTKKHVAALFPMSVSNLNNRIYELLQKKYLVRDKDKVIYVAPPILKAVEHFKKHNSLKLTFTFEGNQDTSAST